jgi:hypothetical protein
MTPKFAALLALSVLLRGQGTEVRVRLFDAVDRRAVEGAQLAVEDANASGGHFRLAAPDDETAVGFSGAIMPDDRAQAETLARRIYSDLGLSKVALLRTDDRGAAQFRAAAERLGHTVLVEQELRAIDTERADAIVIWSDAAFADAIVRQMRAMGMRQRVFGSFGVFGDGPIEGVEVVYPIDPGRDDPAWLAFRAKYERQFGRRPEAFAAYGYDAMQMLLQTIRRVGSDAGRLRDALPALRNFKGVTGELVFDADHRNVVPLYLATAQGFRRYPVQAPYARVGENGVAYHGPAVADAAPGRPTIAIFGPGAERVAADLAPLAEGYTLSGVSSEEPWGKASAKLVKLIYDEQALAIVATDRNAAHLAEQLSVKAFLPVVAISADRDLDSVNIPWMFRLPAGTTPADALRLLLKAAARSGPNRGLLREALAAGAAP